MYLAYNAYTLATDGNVLLASLELGPRIAAFIHTINSQCSAAECRHAGIVLT